MEVMALVLMEQPARIDPDSFRTRVEALRAVATPSAEHLRANTVRARYTAGTIGQRQVPRTSMSLGSTPPRHGDVCLADARGREPWWAGVPFTLRSGKAMPADSAEIAIHFRPMPRYLLDWPGVEPGRACAGLTEPYVRLATTLERGGAARRAGDSSCSNAPRRSAYANLVLEMLRGDATLLIRGDEAEESWRIIDPVTQAWTAGDVSPGAPLAGRHLGRSPPAG